MRSHRPSKSYHGQESRMFMQFSRGGSRGELKQTILYGIIYTLC